MMGSYFRLHFLLMSAHTKMHQVSARLAALNYQAERRGGTGDGWVFPVTSVTSA